MTNAEHVMALHKLRAFAQHQVNYAQHSLDYAREQIVHADPYNKAYYKREIDRCTKRIAQFEPDVAALTWAIEQLSEKAV